MLLRFRMGVRYAALCALICGFAGCSDSSSQEELDLARRSVETALDSWKRGELPAALKSAAQPIDFFDDHWERSARLVEYELTNTYIDTDGTPRCAAGLTVQYEGKDPQRVQVTYQIVRREQRIVIARDPMS